MCAVLLGACHQYRIDGILRHRQQSTYREPMKAYLTKSLLYVLSYKQSTANENKRLGWKHIRQAAADEKRPIDKGCWSAFIQLIRE